MRSRQQPASLTPHVLDPTDRFLRAMLRRTAGTVLAASLGMAGCARSATTTPSPDRSADGPRASAAGSNAPMTGSEAPMAGSGAPSISSGAPMVGSSSSGVFGSPMGAPMAGSGVSSAFQAPLPPPPPEFEQGVYAPTCQGGRWTPLASVYPVMDVDYLSLRGLGNGFEPRIIGERGTLCSGAMDVEACRARVAAETADRPPAYLLTTAGDNVALWGARTAPLLLGPINSPDEALIMARLAGGDEFGVACGSSSIERTSGGWVTRHETGCGPSEAQVGVDGAVAAMAGSCVVPGRRPPGLREPHPRNERGLGAYFATAAHFEAASVHAFEVLADELSALAAPHALVERACAAAADERRHAHLMGALAQRFGARPSPVRARHGKRRSLAAIALDNAREGCVNETLSALLATYQAAAAADPQVRAVMAAIAEDETRHASFSLQLDRWADTRLPDRVRERVHATRREAARTLTGAPLACVDENERRTAGLPDRAASGSLVRSLQASLWA